MNDSAEWTESLDHPGYRAKTIQYNGCTIEIFRPILDDKERAKREAHIKNVAETALRNYYYRKEQTS